MARIARLVVPGLAHHVTQRGNRREPVFFGDEDYRAYLDLLAAAAQKSGTRLIAWCLMPNHLHLIAVPDTEDGLRAMLGDTHRRYTARINARNRWTGHLWQGRFGSVAMDEDHLAHAVRYVSLNPVRARLVAQAQDWPWSSVRAHLSGRSDGITTSGPCWSGFLILRTSSPRRRTRPPLHCAGPKPAAARSARRPSWRASKSSPDASCIRASGGRDQG